MKSLAKQFTAGIAIAFITGLSGCGDAPPTASIPNSESTTSTPLTDSSVTSDDVQHEVGEPVDAASAYAGFLVAQNSASSGIMDQRFREDAPAIVDPDDVSDFDPAGVPADVGGTVLDVGPSTLVVEDKGSLPATVTVTVPGTAEVTRNGNAVKLSAVQPGDYVLINAAIKNSVLTANRVAAHKLR